MQIFLIPTDPKIEASELFAVIKQEFDDKQLSSGIEGNINVCRRRVNDFNNFFLEFFAAVDFRSYRAGDRYITPARNDFSIIEFDDGADMNCRKRLAQFRDDLNSGLLKPHPKSL